MKKISYGQMIVLLLVFRFLRTVTFNPFVNTDSVIVIWAVLASTVFQGVLVLPLVWIYNKYPDKDINRIAYDVSKPFGICVSLLYRLFFFLVALKAVKNFTYFMLEMFPGTGSKAVIVITLLVVSGYGAYLGLESIARSSGFVIVLVFVMLALMIVTIKGDLDFINIYIPADKTAKSFFNCFVQETGMNSEIVAVAVLLPNIRAGIKKGIYGYLTLKLILIELVIVLYTALFGEYVKNITLPFFALGAYSKTRFIERLDPLYMLVWTLCAIVTIALAIYLSVQCTKNVLIKIKKSLLYIIFTAVCMAVILPFKLKMSVIDIAFDKWINSILIVLLVCIIPLITVFIYGNSVKRNIRKGEE